MVSAISLSISRIIVIWASAFLFFSLITRDQYHSKDGAIHLSSSTFTVEALTNRAFSPNNHHRFHITKTNTSSTSKHNQPKNRGGFFTRTKQKIKSIIFSSSADSPPSVSTTNYSDPSQTLSSSLASTSSDMSESVHLQLQSEAMKTCMRENNPSPLETEENNENIENPDGVNEEEKPKKPQTFALRSYTDPVSNLTLLGLNIPKRKFHAWVDHTLLTMHINEIEQKEPNVDENIKIKREDPPFLDVNLSFKEEIRVDNEETRAFLRQVWRERRLVSERTEILATYASNRTKVVKEAEEAENKVESDKNKQPSKRGGFTDLLHTYADRLISIVKDEQEDFDLYNKLIKEDMEVDSVSIVESGALLDWIKKDYGDEEIIELNSNNLLQRSEEEQFKTLQKFLDWFRSRFPYYYDRCGTCGASAKDNPPPPPPANTNENADGETEIILEDEETESDKEQEDHSVFLGYVYPSEEELKGKATRTEIYWCNQCGAFTRFPRFNSASWVVNERRGRCGEYSMLLFRMLRSVGFESRWVIDWADHVWAEVKIGGRWVHADPCEAALDKPLLYQEWGKQQTHIIAFNAPPLDFFNFDKQEEICETYDIDASFWEKLEPLVEDVTSSYTSDSLDDIQKRRDEPVDVIESSLTKVKTDLRVKLQDLRTQRSK